MPNPISRDSLVKTLEDRYNTQSAGGAFNAKKIDTVAGNIVPTDRSAVNVQDTIYREGGFKIKYTKTGFKDVMGYVSRQLSQYIKGFNNKRYK
jgi:hypothetical protein